MRGAGFQFARVPDEGLFGSPWFRFPERAKTRFVVVPQIPQAPPLCCQLQCDLHQVAAMPQFGIMDYGLWIMDYGLWIMDYGLRIMNYELDESSIQNS
jgi:hypothetical protein